MITRRWPVCRCGTGTRYLNVSKSKVKLIAAQQIQIWVEGAQRQVSRDAKSSGLMRSPSAPGAHRDPRCCSPVALALCLRPRPHLRCSEHVATQARGRNPADPQSYLERFLARGRRGPSSSSTSSSDTARQQTLSCLVFSSVKPYIHRRPYRTRTPTSDVSPRHARAPCSLCIERDTQQ